MSEDSRQGAANLLKPVWSMAAKKRGDHQAKAMTAYNQGRAITGEVEAEMFRASVWGEVADLLGDQIKYIEPREHDPA